MTQESFLAGICFFIAAIPFAGIPGAWKMYLTAALGLIAGVLALGTRTRIRRMRKKVERWQELVASYEREREERRMPKYHERHAERHSPNPPPPAAEHRTGESRPSWPAHWPKRPF